MIWTIFVHLRATPGWLRLTPTERDAIAAESLAQALADERVTMRFYDAEAFSGLASDIAVFETSDMLAYYFTMERLRNTPLISAPYFDVVSITPALENGFRAFQQAEAGA
ncbi:darcynin family protein [Pararhodobacter sp.]|uniref:darcynin family protein n=1 Tax=Pararhodobacter sp. TaxID=2127056 RepID=UPI002FE381BD